MPAAMPHRDGAVHEAWISGRHGMSGIVVKTVTQGDDIWGDGGDNYILDWQTATRSTPWAD